VDPSNVNAEEDVYTLPCGLPKTTPFDATWVLITPIVAVFTVRDGAVKIEGVINRIV
jgi:hypothetical protein